MALAPQRVELRREWNARRRVGRLQNSTKKEEKEAGDDDCAWAGTARRGQAGKLGAEPKSCSDAFGPTRTRPVSVVISFPRKQPMGKQPPRNYSGTRPSS